jgi:hypothetical protein
MRAVANASRRASGWARGIGSTPGRPASPIDAPHPPLHDLTPALAPRSGTVACTPRAPRASPAFPAKGERDRAMPHPFQHGTVPPSPSTTPFEPKLTRASRISSTSRARALKKARPCPHRYIPDLTDPTYARSSLRRPESTAPLPNP